MAALVALANPAACAVFQVIEPWVRPANAAATTEAYMRLVSSDGTTLVGVRSPAASRVELATGLKRTSPPFELALPPRATVLLAPGSTRIVLRQLAHPLKLGEHVPITLVLRHADGTEQQIDVVAEVRRRSASDDHRVPHKH
jgi:periplasmic copper chaperone A